ncbi:MAG: DUF2236 domain-containing protein [Thermoleophilaceae bacterium]|nr:DUF2236 domain-containing protein [Thermoleophilaceae bacterium]
MSKLSKMPFARREFGFRHRRRIAALDPAADDRELYHRSFEVLYGTPVFVHSVFLVVFIRQAAVPRIANILYRNGHGDSVVSPAKRNDATLTFFSEFIRLGYQTPEGIEAIKVLERIHDRFPITDEDKLYTLATVVFDPEREIALLGGKQFTAREHEAMWHFWQGVATHMSLGHIAKTRKELKAWMVKYEAENYAYSTAGRAVAEAMISDYGRWFPKRAKQVSRHLMLALLDENLRKTLRLEDPHPLAWRFQRTVGRVFLRTAPYRPVPIERSWGDHFGSRWGEQKDLAAVGHKAPPTGAGEPEPAQP